MSEETRTVSVKLVLDIDKNAPRMFQTFAREANKANKKVAAELERGMKETESKFLEGQKAIYKGAGTAAQLGFGEAGYRASRVAGFAGGLQNLGFGGAARFAQGMAAPLAIAGGAANLAAFAANAHYDKYSTNDQIHRAFVRDIVPGGETAQKYLDIFSGRNAGYEQAGINREVRTARGQSYNEEYGFALGNEPRQAGARANAALFGVQRAPVPGVFDRSVAAGEIQYRQDQRILPLKQAQAKAEREAAAAVATRMATEKQLEVITTRGTVILDKRNKLWQSLSEPGNASGASRENVLKDLSQLHAELKGNYAIQRQGKQAVAEATARAASATGEFAKARSNTDLLGRAGALEDSAQRGLDTASRLGAMNPYERQFALQSLRNGQEYGFDALPPEAQQAALSVGGETARKLQQQAGLKSPAYAELGKIAPSEAPSNPQDLQRQADELRKQQVQKEFDIDRSAAEAVTASGANLGADIARIINLGFDAIRHEIFVNVYNAKNAK